MDLEYKGKVHSRNCFWLCNNLPFYKCNCIVCSTAYKECKEACNNCQNTRTCRDSDAELFTFLDVNGNKSSLKTCARLASSLDQNEQHHLCMLAENPRADSAAVICPNSYGMCNCSLPCPLHWYVK